MPAVSHRSRAGTVAGAAGPVTEIRGTVRLALMGDGPHATLRIDDASVHISLETGIAYAYPRDAVYWNPLDAHTVRMEIGEERIFFVSPQPLDFHILDHPDSQRRLPPLPPIGSHWTELRPAAEDSAPEEGQPTPWTNVPAGTPEPEQTRTPRSRRRRPVACVHQWRRLKLAGGLTRAVCSECGELSLQSGR
jgi:hypothetical protein